MQVRDLEFFVERSLYYLFSKYVASYGNKQLMQRDDSKYSSLFPTYSINILDFKQFEDNKAVHKFNLYDIENEIKLSNEDKITLGYFELGKEDKTLNTNLKYWKNFFIKGKVDNNAPDYIQKATKIIKFGNLSEEERIVISNVERAREDAIAREIFAENKGIEQGIEQGIEKKELEIVMKSLEANLDIELISKITGLSEVEIEKIKNKM